MSLLAFSFIPIYLRCLGPEAYGLIGVFATLQAVFTLVDTGLGTTINRGLARLSVNDDVTRQRTLLRTLEVVYWGISAMLGIVVVVTAPLIGHWVRADQLSIDTIVRAVRLMGVIAALQLPFGLYQSAMLGLQRQVTANVVLALSAMVRGGGAVIVLVLIKPSIMAYFTWLLLAAALQTLAMMLLLWRVLGGRQTSRYDRAVLRAQWPFAAGMMANAAVGTLLMQVDKVILSGLVPLREFGYYALAATATSVLWLVMAPINQAIFPRFSEIIARGDRRALVDLYHKGVQAIGLLLLPPAVTLALFSREAVFLWTGDPIAAVEAARVMPLLICGIALYGLASVPVYVQYASGWPELSFYTNLLVLGTIVPASVLLVRNFGSPGAAVITAGLGMFFVCGNVPLMHERIMKAERRRWLLHDVAIPTVTAVAVAVPFRVMAPGLMPPITTVAYLAVTMVISFAAILVGSSSLRPIVLSRLRGASTLPSY